MHIDLTAAEAAVKALKEELGLTHRASCIGLDLWAFSSGNRELTIKIHVFDKDDRCQQGSGPTSEIALERVRQKLVGLEVELGTEPVTVEVQAPTEEVISAWEQCPKTEICSRRKDHEGACDEIPF